MAGKLSSILVTDPANGHPWLMIGAFEQDSGKAQLTRACRGNLAPGLVLSQHGRGELCVLVLLSVPVPLSPSD